MYHSDILIHSGFLNHYGFHQTIWDLFPNNGSAKREFLYRLEAVNGHGHARVLLQSIRPPSPTRNAEILSCEVFPLELACGLTELRFTLTANPTKQQSAILQGAVKSKRISLADPRDQRDWLIRKLSSAAEVATVSTYQLPKVAFRKPREDFRWGVIQPVLFTGTLRVTDPAGLFTLLQNGIGRAKGFGCGLLTVLPMAAQMDRAM